MCALPSPPTVVKGSHFTYHHHPSSEQAVLSILVHKATLLCERDSLRGDPQLLRSTLRHCGFSNLHIQQALYPFLTSRVLPLPSPFPFVGMTLNLIKEGDAQVQH